MQLRIGEHILTLRRERKIRQEELADFLGVTKASVSKWETKQSYPDILLLPQIAAFFNISIDELLGYEPQLSKTQINKIYQKLAYDFAHLPFEDAMKKTKELVKEYYSCYPFLFHMTILWLNHFTMSEDPARRTEILNDIADLCNHIIEGCNDVNLQKDTIAVKELANLNLGNLIEVIEVLQPFVDSKNYQFQPDSILITAYQLSGDMDQADYYSQIILYTNLINLVQNSIVSLNLHSNDLDQCMLTIHRINAVMEAYHLEQLNPNTALQFFYQSAIIYSMYGRKEEAIAILTRFVKGSIQFIKTDFQMHGDSYFTHMDKWFEDSPLGTVIPRNAKLVYESLGKALENPAFQSIAGESEFQYLQKILLRKEEF